MGVAFAPILVPFLREDSGVSEVVAWLPKNYGGFSPVGCRGRAEPDAWYDWGLGRRLCEPRLFPRLFCIIVDCVQKNWSRSEISGSNTETGDLCMCESESKHMSSEDES